MANIARFDPFSTSLNDLFEGLLVRQSDSTLTADSSSSMKLDVMQDDKAYTVKADIPGVKKEDIHVEDRRQCGIDQCRSEAGKGREKGLSA